MFILITYPLKAHKFLWTKRAARGVYSGQVWLHMLSLTSGKRFWSKQLLKIIAGGCDIPEFFFLK